MLRHGVCAEASLRWMTQVFERHAAANDRLEMLRNRTALFLSMTYRGCLTQERLWHPKGNSYWIKLKTHPKINLIQQFLPVHIPSQVFGKQGHRPFVVMLGKA